MSKKKPAPKHTRLLLILIPLALAASLALLFLSSPPTEPDPVSNPSDSAHLPSTGNEPPARPLIPDQEEVFSTYAGTESCRECHQLEYDLWLPSNHSLAERHPSPALDGTAFAGERQFQHGDQASTAFTQGTNFIVRTRGYDNEVEDYRVERVIGNEPLRQYLVPGPGNRLQTLEASYDPHRDEWFNVYGDEDRQPGEWGHWTGRGMNWNAMCASCHNTRLRKNYDVATDTYQTARAEMTVGCEACHGPMKDHVEWQRDYRDSGKPDPTLVEHTREQTLHTCASCHSRRSELTGDFVPGDHYSDHYGLVVPDLSDVYHPDGQVHGENYVYAAFRGSKMHAAGVHCLDCHNPHSNKRLLEDNLLCMRCHSGGYPNSPIINPTEHSFHAENSTGNQCVNCHMPQTTYMQRHPRRDHGFTIPDPMLTRKYGVPNACNRCHTDKDAAWAEAAVEEWYGDKMDRHSRHRAEWIARARRGDTEVRDELIGLLTGDDQPYWKAVAANVLEPWVDQAPVRQALLQSLNHTNALVRGHAVQTLEPLAQAGQTDAIIALRDRLDDASRFVRVYAAWGLRGIADPPASVAGELDWFIRYQMDQPTGRMQMGTFQLANGDVSAALENYRKAVEWDPFSPPMRHELAVVLSMAGQSREAVEQLREAIRLDPDEAEYHYKLALGLSELGGLTSAIPSFREAVRLQPGHARAWYNLGLALHQTGQSLEGIEALIRAESAEPGDPRIPYARATILAQLGRRNDALDAAGRALEIQPGYGPALQLRQSLGGY